MNWYLAVLRNYVGFSGRAQRAEFWWFTLINVIISVILSLIDEGVGTAGPDGGGGLLSVLYALAVLLPGLAVGVRRLHDIGRTGWWVLIGLIPIIGQLVLIYFWVQDSEGDENRFGPNPKGAGGEPAGDAGMSA